MSCVMLGANKCFIILLSSLIRCLKVFVIGFLPIIIFSNIKHYIGTTVLTTLLLDNIFSLLFFDMTTEGQEYYYMLNSYINKTHTYLPWG